MKQLLKPLFKLIITPMNLCLKSRNNYFIGRFGQGLGDHLLMTAIIDELKGKFIVATYYPEFFENNSQVKKVINLRKKNAFSRNFIHGILYFSNSSNIIHFQFKKVNGLNYEDYMRKTQSKLHIISTNMINTKYFNRIKKKKLHAKLYFSKEETKKYVLPKQQYVIIHSEAKTSYTEAKNYGKENMQKIVNGIKVNWVQLGTKNDSLLKGTIDKRGLSLRESLWLMKNAKFIVCTEGFMTHASAAFNTKCYTIFSDFSPVELSKYKNVVAIQPKIKKYSWKTGKVNNSMIKLIKPETIIKKIKRK